MIKYSIKKDEENSTDYFHIDEKEGTIHLKQSLDHETRPFHHIVLEATDSGLPSLSTTAHLWITGLIYNIHILQLVYIWSNILFLMY